MRRSIPPGLSGILEQLELEQPVLVTISDLDRLVGEQGIKTPTKVVAARLRERGWLLPTGRRGVWEFVPAAVAGPYSRNDPVMPLKAFLIERGDVRCGLTFQAAAWAHGIADRSPIHVEVAANSSYLARQLPGTLSPAVFNPRLEYQQARTVPVLAPESILVHMAARPSAVRSWASALEWVPDLSERLSGAALSYELDGRSKAIQARVGYFLQGLRPDLAEMVRNDFEPTSKTWFGPREVLRRHDAYWQVADTILPFDPRDLPAVT